MAVYLGAIAKKKNPVYVFNVYDYTGFFEGKKPKLVKTEKIRRSNQRAAEDFIRHKWSYQKTNHNYQIEYVNSYN